MKRRILSFFLALALLLTLLPPISLPAGAEGPSESCGDNLTWSFDTETGLLTIEGSGAMADYDYDTAPWYAFQASICSISLPDGLTSIGSYAFSGCTALTSVTIPEGVTSIGSWAFSGCAELTAAEIPDSVTELREGTFSDCNSLSSVTLSSGLTCINGSTFSHCRALSDVTIPEGVTSIGDFAFYSCDALTSIAIPESVTEIGFLALGWTWSEEASETVKVEDFTIIGSLGSAAQTYAEDNGFRFLLPNGETPPATSGSCGENLTWSFNPDNGVLTISGSGAMTDYDMFAFEGCTVAPWREYKDDIVQLNLPDGLTSIGSFAFIYCSALPNVVIPDSVTSIGQAAFAVCDALEVVSIGSGVTSIGDAFVSCNALTAISVSPDNPAFSSNCGVLFNKTKTELLQYPAASQYVVYTIPDTVTSIDQSAFLGCTRLQHLTIPASLVSIGSDLFSGCTGLTQVNLAEGLTSIGDRAFSDCTSLPQVSIPASVTSVGRSAFEGCSALTGVTFREGLTGIGVAAFFRCNALTEVTIPRSVTSIGVQAFGSLRDANYNVYTNENFTIYGYSNTAAQTYAQETGVRFVSLGGEVYSGDCGTDLSWTLDMDSGLLTIEGNGAMDDYSDTGVKAPWYDYRESILALSLPEGLTEVGSYAFCDCSDLPAVTVPESVTRIGDRAFGWKKNGSNGSWERVVDFTISGYINSAALPYALENMLEFVILDNGMPSGSIGDNLRWYLNTETGLLTIHDYGVTGMPDFDEGGAPWYAWRDSIRSITLSKCKDYVGSYAFYGCTALTEVTISGSIGASAFSGCTGLTEATISGSVSDSAFAGCTGLTEVTIEGGQTIGASAFSGCTGLTEVTIPYSVSTIGERAFYNCTALTRAVVLRYGSFTIGSEAFGWCWDETGGASERVANFTLWGWPESSANTYANRNELAFVDVTPLHLVFASGACGDSLTWTLDTSGTLNIIGEGAMPDNTSPWDVHKFRVKEIVLGDGVTNIGVGAFYSCCYAERLWIGAGMTGTIHPNGFNVLYGMDQYSTLVEIQVASDNPCYCSLDGVLFNKEITELILYPGGKQCASYSIPVSVTSIGDRAFYSSGNLTKVSIPDGVTSIGANAFDRSALKNVKLPASVTSIGTRAFAWDTWWGSHCNKNFVVIGYTGSAAQAYAESNELFFSAIDAPLIGGSCGENLSWHLSLDLTVLTIEGSGSMESAPWFGTNYTDIIETVKLPYGLTSICGDAFHSCDSLTQITIPKSVTYIGAWAFCQSDALTDVTVLNPDCEIVQNGTLYNADDPSYCSGTLGLAGKTVIHGYPSSTAEAYANQYGYPFQALEEPELFSDVPENAYYAEPVSWAMEAGITAGTSPNSFSPKQSCTRAQILTFLWRAAGSPEPNLEESPFDDVQNPDAWYYKAVLWAYEKGITSGVRSSVFGVGHSCTRAQVVTFLWRAAGSPEPAVTESPFLDVQDPGDWYYQAVLWAGENSITAGTAPDAFSPDQICTRAQVVTFLYRFYMGNDLEE